VAGGTPVGVTSDPAAGGTVGGRELPAPPGRFFRALASRDVADWWGRPGVSETRAPRAAADGGGSRSLAAPRQG